MTTHATDQTPAQTAAAAGFDEIIENGPFPIRFPGRTELDQDEEWCEVEIDGEWRRIRFHDYSDVYRIPGLYETIFYRTLRCNSPSKVAELLRDVLVEHGGDPQDLRVLDLGAGNGMMGEAVQNLGSRNIVGVDIIEEAAEAARRDRPWVYNDYLVADLTDLDDGEHHSLREAEFNSLTTVAALGFGDIPQAAFYTAYNLVEDGGWIAFNIKEDFLKDEDQSEFSGLISRMTRKGVLQIEAYKRYCHRLNIAGEPLYYISVVGQKLRDIPQAALGGTN
ncbi:MAG: methyltransferase domain-containing protein [Planctomycetaceae bacterium]